MAFIEYAVKNWPEHLEIEDSVNQHAERQMGPQRLLEIHANLERVRWSNFPRELLLQRDRLHWRALRQPERSRFTALAGDAKGIRHRPWHRAFKLSQVATTPTLHRFRDADVPGIVAGTETGILALTVSQALIEQVEVREGDTYSMCVSGSPTSPCSRST